MSTPKKQFDRMADILRDSSNNAFKGVDELNRLIEDFGRAAIEDRQADPESESYDEDSEQREVTDQAQHKDDGSQAGDVAGGPAVGVKATSPAPKQKRRRKKGVAKKKTTHYLNRDVYKELDKALDKLRGLLPEDVSKTEVSKSGMVNYALKVMLDEFETKGEKSELVRKLISEIKPEPNE